MRKTIHDLEMQIAKKQAMDEQARTNVKEMEVIKNGIETAVNQFANKVDIVDSSLKDTFGPRQSSRA